MKQSGALIVYCNYEVGGVRSKLTGWRIRVRIERLSTATG
jgi:hypothetical protein